MESEDEDVLFENSVLHQALTDLGVSDLETEPRLYMQEQVDSKENSLEEANILKSFKESKQHSFNSSFMTRIFISPKLLEEVHHYHRYNILKWLISCNLLSEYDQLFLESYVEEEAPTRDPRTCLSLCTFQMLGILITSLTLVGVVCPLDVQFTWTNILIDNLPQIFLGLSSWALSLTLIMIVWIVGFLIPVIFIQRNVFQKVLTQLQIEDKCIKDLVIQAEELLHLEKKSLRLIKESELVARGFTLANQHHVASRNSNGLTSSSSYQLCLGLREILFSENVKVMQEVKKRVVKMLRDIPMICKDSDFSSLETLKMCTSQFHHSDDRSSNVSHTTCTIQNECCTSTMDGHGDLIISPAELSKSVELLSVYFSGFVRRLAMCFYPRNLKDSNINPYVATKECTDNCKKTIEKASLLLKQSYTFYRSVHHYSGNVQAKKLQQRKGGDSQAYKLYICVNSLDLHLQSLLQITRNLTVALEEQVDKEQSFEDSADSSDSKEDNKKMWEESLKRIKSGLDSCRGCHEESLKALHKKIDNDTTILPVKKSNQDKLEPKQTNIILLAPEEPVIVDQVFEAINDSSDDESISESRPKFTAEDRAKFQEEKEAITRFRQELYTVVGHRAIVQKAREEMALARVRGEDTSSQQSVQELPSNFVPITSPEILINVTNGLGCSENGMKLEAGATAMLASKLSLEEGESVPEILKPLDTEVTLTNELPISGEPSLGLENEKLKAKFRITADENSFDTIPTKEESKRMSELMTKESALSFHSSGKEREEHKVPPCESKYCPVVSIEEDIFKEKIYNGQLNRITAAENCSLDSIKREDKSVKHLDHKQLTVNSECECLSNVKTENKDILYDYCTLKEHNPILNQEKGICKNSEPYNTNYINEQSSYVEALNCLTGSDSNWDNSLCDNDSVNLTDLHTNEDKKQTFLGAADTKSASTFLKQTSALLPDCNESTPTQNTYVQLDFHNMRTSHKTFNTTDEGKGEPQKQEKIIHNKNLALTPFIASSNFTKNIALMAAFQARNLNSNFEEEHFGDDSSDSENSASENDIIDITDDT